MHRRALLALGLLSLCGCATGGGPAVRPATPPLAELEPLYAATAGREALVISVASNGCTRKDDFAVHVERKGEAVTLAFGRKRIDPCKSFAMGRTELTFTWTELGVPAQAQVFLLNPMTAWTGPGS